MPISLSTAAQLPKTAVTWLWPDYIPLGGVTMVEGLPQSCKSSLLCDIAARITTGRPMPLCDAPTPIGNVLVLNSEDPPESLQERLTLAGADLERVHLCPLTGQKPSFPTDIAELERLITEHEIRLVVLDPLESYVPGALTSGKSMRDLMDELNALAQRTTIAVVGVRHLLKAATPDVIYRAAGSYSITAAARAELIVVADPLDHSQRVIAPLKSNLGPARPGVIFKPTPAETGITLDWIGYSPSTIADLLDQAVARERPQIEFAKKVLFTFLAEGPLPVKDAKKLAMDAGVKEKTLQRAKRELGVESVKRGFGPSSQWYWRLPDRDHPAVKPLWEAELSELMDKLCTSDEGQGSTAPSPDNPTKRQRRKRTDDGESGEAVAE